MINTLQQIDKKVRAFCDNDSAIVNEYLSGDFSTFNSADHKYPLIFLTPIKTRIQDGQVQFICNISFIDLCYEKSELMKILSDLNILITELFIYLTDDRDNDMYFLTLLTPSEFQPFYRGIDNTCGYQGDVTFKLVLNISVQDIRTK